MCWRHARKSTHPDANVRGRRPPAGWRRFNQRLLQECLQIRADDVAGQSWSATRYRGGTYYVRTPRGAPGIKFEDPRLDRCMGDGYLIAHVDAAYTETIIARSRRDCVWIMARTPEIPSADFARLERKVADLGYDTSELERVPQRW